MGACGHSSDSAGGDGVEVKATWYEVPSHDHGGKGDLTAASNQFDVGTRVRVTRISNGKSIVVRIAGILRGKNKNGIDLCKEAAEELEMVSDGVAEVKVKALP